MKIAFDTTLMRPGCALIQAALGADPMIASEFNTDDWLIAPTPDMGCFEVTPEQLEILKEKVAARGTVH